MADAKGTERETSGTLAGHVADGAGHTNPAEQCRCNGPWVVVEIDTGEAVSLDEYEPNLWDTQAEAQAWAVANGLVGPEYDAVRVGSL